MTISFSKLVVLIMFVSGSLGYDLLQTYNFLTADAGGFEKNGRLIYEDLEDFFTGGERWMGHLCFLGRAPVVPAAVIG